MNIWKNNPIIEGSYWIYWVNKEDKNGMCVTNLYWDEEKNDFVFMLGNYEISIKAYKETLKFVRFMGPIEEPEKPEYDNSRFN